MNSGLTAVAKRVFLRMLAGIRTGSIEVECEDGEIRRFGDSGADLRARLQVHHARFYRRLWLVVVSGAAGAVAVCAGHGLLPVKLRAFLDFAAPRLKERLARLM